MKRNPTILLLLICTCLLCHVQLKSQSDDHISWTSISLSKNINNDWTAIIKPITRRNNNLKDYQNTSIDYLLRRKVSKMWSAQMIGRTWFMPNAGNRQFIWFDALQTLSLGKDFLMKNRFRYHLALNIYDRIDPDFIRWDAQFTFNKPWRVVPYISLETWFRTEGFNEIQRTRYIAGFNAKLTDRLGLSAQYWRQQEYRGSLLNDVNIWVVNLGYKL